MTAKVFDSIIQVDNLIKNYNEMNKKIIYIVWLVISLIIVCMIVLIVYFSVTMSNKK